MNKKTFNEILQDKHGIELANEFAKVFKKEKSLYTKAHKNLVALLMQLPDAKAQGSQNGKNIEITVKSLTMNQQKYYDRYIKLLEMGMKYAYPQVKAVEVKADPTGKVAFNISIPQPTKGNKTTKKESKKK